MDVWASTYVHLYQYTVTYSTVCQCRTLQMLNYILLTVVVSGYNCIAVCRHTAACHTNRARGMLSPSTYDDTVCVMELHGLTQIKLYDPHTSVN